MAKSENKAKCRSCEFLDWDFQTDGTGKIEHHFCGLHGRAPVDPDGKQPDFDHQGGCGYSKKPAPRYFEAWDEH